MQRFFMGMLSLLVLVLIIAIAMAIRATTPKQKVAEQINISYEKAFSQAENGEAKVVPVLINAWSDDSRTGNDNWYERWGEGEVPNSNRPGYEDFSKKVIASFYYIGGKSALPYIFKELRSYDKSKRKSAKRVVQLLISRSIIDEACLPVVSEALKDRNDEIRHMATVIASGSPDWFIPSLEKLLKDKNKIIRYEAAYALAKLHKTSSKPILLLALKDKNPQIRQEAISSLALIGKVATKITTMEGTAKIGTASIPTLQKGIQSKDTEIQRLSIQGLGRLKDKSSASILSNLLAYKNLQYLAIDALTNIGTLSVPILLRKLTDKNIEIQTASIIALGRIGDKSASPELIKKLQSVYPQIRLQAIVALGDMKDKSAVPMLVKLLKTKDMKYALLKALGQICLGQTGTKEAIDALLEALKYEPTKIESAKILCEIGNREGALVLLKGIKQRTINPKDVLFHLAKSKDKKAIAYLKDYYYPATLIRAADRKPKIEFVKPQEPVATFEDKKGVTFSIFNWFIYGSNDDIWLRYSKDKKQWSPPIFTGLISAPKRTGRSVTPLEFKVRIEGDKIIFAGKVKESGPFNDEKMRQWQEITTLQRLTQDTDKDELTDIEESRIMTNPKEKDTDNDGLLDGIDINPLVGRVKTDDGKLIRQAVFAYNLQGGYVPLVIVLVNDVSQKQEFLGLEGIVLCLTPIELAEFRENIGYGIPIFSFDEIKYDRTKEKAEVEFATFIRPKSGHGVIFKLEKVHGIWVVIDQGPLWKS
ncbi:MAG: HEAT repeat domain-containing protein [Nitrospirota bacterium]